MHSRWKNYRSLIVVLGVLNRTLAILSIKPTAEVHLVSVVEIINSDQKHETSFP